MRRVAAYLAAMMALLSGHGMASAGGTQTTVLQLFTSHGCSSSPPAAVLFATYAKPRDLVVETVIRQQIGAAIAKAICTDRFGMP